MNQKVVKILLIISLFSLTPASYIYAKSDNAHSGNGQGGNEHSSVGHVETIKSNKVTILDDKSESVDAVIDKSTKVVGANKKLLNVKQLKMNDKIAIISSDSATASGSAVKRAIKIFVKQASDSASMKHRAVQGIVTNVSGTTVTLVHQIHHDRVTTVTLTPTTQIKIKGIQTGTAEDITVGERIIVMGDVDVSGALVAKRVHVIPGKAVGVFNKITITPSVTLPSASVSPTTSVTLTPTITSTPSATPTETATPSASPTP